MREITNFRVAALEEAGIAIQYGSEVTPELLERERPDVLIVATGSVAARPAHPGDRRGKRRNRRTELLSGRKPLRGSHIVVLGGGLVGCEAADYLAAAGRRVEIVEMTDKLADGLNQSRRRFLLKRLSEHGVAAHLLTKAERVALPEVRVCSQNYSYALEGVDGVVVARRTQPARPPERVGEGTPARNAGLCDRGRRAAGRRAGRDSSGRPRGGADMTKTEG